MFDQLSARLDRAVWVDRKEGDGSAAILSCEQEASAGVHRDVGAASVTDGFRIQVAELAGVSDSIGCNGRAAVVANRVERLTVRMLRQKAGGSDLCCEACLGQDAFFSIECRLVNPFAASTEINIHLIALGDEVDRDCQEHEKKSVHARFLAKEFEMSIVL